MPRLRCVTDLDLRITAIDPALCDALGRPADDLLGRRWLDAVPPEMHPAFVRYADAVRADALCFPLSCPLLGSADRRLDAEQIARRRGEVIEIGVRLVDAAIDDDPARARRALADALAGRAQAESFLANIVETIADPIFVKDEDHRWIMLNEPMCAFMGRPRAELVGKSDYDFFPKEQADVFWEKDDEVFARGGVSVNRESFDDADGVTHTISTKKAVFTDHDGRKVLVGVIRDMTAEVEALARAEAGTRAKSAFVATMSHEIRTPLNGIIGLADMLSTTRLDAEQLDFARLIKRSGEALLTIVSDVLDLARIEAGRLELECVPFDLADRVRESAELFRVEAERRGLALRVGIDEALGRVEGDPGRLGQVLVNLVGNAVKFTLEGRIDVSARRDGDAVRFAVRDTGIGMDEEVRAALCQPFMQGEASIRRRFGGTGLGLAICRELLAAMGGSLEISSAPGAGSTFGFTLDLPVVAPASTAPPPSIDTYAIRAGRVLLAEDNPINQRVGQRMLERLGQRVDVAADGAEALSALRREAYDLVLMDCHMPDLDGLEVTRRVRAEDGPCRAAPIVALTADATIETRERCLEAGMDDHLSKPITLLRLTETLARWLPAEPDVGSR